MVEKDRVLFGVEDLRQIQRVNEEIARLAKLAGRPVPALPLFEAGVSDGKAS